MIVQERVAVFGGQVPQPENLVLLDLGLNETVISNTTTAKIIPGLHWLCRVLERDIMKFLESMLRDLLDRNRVDTTIATELFPQLSR